MLLLAVITVGVAGLAAGCLYARERRRRLAAEWDRDAADRAAGQRQDDFDDQAERYQKAIEGCRLRASEAIAERTRPWRTLAAARRELELQRQDFEMRGRSQGEAVAVGQRREREAADLLRDALTLLSP
jgi:hypothetical protein